MISLIPRNLPPSLKFLHPYIQSCANPPRHTVVHTAIHNQSFFSTLNNYVLKSSRAGYQYRAILSFWASIVTEAIAGMLDQITSGRQEVQKQKEKDILLRILPFLNEALSMRKVPDLRVGCYMILTVLSSKAHLEDNVLDAIMEAVVGHWTTDTTHAGLICLTVLSQNKQTVKLPQKVYNAILSIKDVEDDLATLRTRYEVGKLTFGLVLGIIESLGKETDARRLKFIRSAIEVPLMDDVYVSEVVKSILSTAGSTTSLLNNQSDVRGQLTDLILKVSDSKAVGQTVRNTIRDADVDIEELEMKLQAVIRPALVPPILSIEDVEMEDVTQKTTKEAFEDVAKQIPTKTAHEISFLSHSESYVFGSLCHAFLLASSSIAHLHDFSNFSILRKSLAMSEPLCFSFYIRIWCGPYPAIARSAALICVGDYFKGNDLTVDVQFLLPYIVYALGDMSIKVRRAAIDLVVILSSVYIQAVKADKEQKDLTILGENDIYGSSQEKHSISWISLTDATKFIEEILIPNLEECHLDAGHISRRLAKSLDVSSQSRKSNLPQKELKTAVRTAIFKFMSTHIINTPLYSVKIRVLSMLNQVEKVGSISRTKLLLPLLESQAGQSEETCKEICSKVELTGLDFVTQLVGIISPSDRDGLRLLQNIILSVESSWSRALRRAAFQRIQVIWVSIRPEMHILLSETLLDLATGLSQNTSTEDIEGQAIGVLRSIPLSTNILLSMLANLPGLLAKSADGPSASKRRRTGHGHLDTVASSDSADTSKAVKRITAVLELVESSKAGKAPQLLKVLFQVLADVQHSRNQRGIELGYIQSLVLKSLHEIIEKAKVGNPS